MPRPPRAPRPAAVLLLAGAALLAAPPATGQSPGELETSLRYGREALAAGRHDEALRHLLHALARSEDPAPALALLLENAAADPDARALWAHDFHAVAGDAAGKLKASARRGVALEADDPWPARIAAARAKAVREILRLRDQRARAHDAGALVATEWLEDLARTLAEPASALRRLAAGDAEPALPVPPHVWDAVLGELERTVRAALGTGDRATALRAARVLRGLGAQASFDDLEGPAPPDLGAALAAAAEGLGRARALLAADAAAVRTIADLEAMSIDEQRAFTLAHASFGEPGVSLSPRGWYRVETSCGWETLLGAATTVELHHERLGRWYGQDPFVDRPGVLRVVPEANGLEMEGSPFWWAGGFQGGDITVLQFTIGSIPGLGRGITHELTHRFDGAVYGGLPAWLSEGRAVWTASAYGSMHDLDFVPDHASFGTMISARQMGYGEREKLEELVAGTIEEYRDNYTAGYALYVFLNTWSGVDPEPVAGEEAHEIPPAERVPMFRARLHAFMEGDRRRRGDPLEVFASSFADGADGRPLGMAAFAEEFVRFLDGFAWREPARWRDERYTEATPPGDPSPTVMDEPTWTWERHRAEPWFGQEQARVAAELFAERERWREAGLAFCWSLGVDEPAPADLDLFAAALEHDGESEAAWMLRRWPRFRQPGRTPPPLAAAPFRDELPATGALLAAWAEAAAAYAAADRLIAAEAMAAEHDRLGAWLGAPELVLPPAAREERARRFLELRAAGRPLHPFDAPARLLGRDGWGEEGLTGYEERRVPGLWFEEADHDLHVGRREARQGTDTMDRDAPWRDAFVLAREWLEPGRYRIETTIEFTTAYVSGGIALGWTRRDRNLRAGFGGGDTAFAMGEAEASRGMEGVSWSLDGLYARRGALHGHHAFASDRKSFAVEILVDGPSAELRLDGELVGWFTSVDGSPIHGRVGFYTSQGAFRARAPLVQRLDRESWSAAGEAPGRGLHPFRRGLPSWSELVGRPVTGLPLHPSGTVLLWIPDQSEERLAAMKPGDWEARVVAALDDLVEQYGFEDPSQGLSVLLPPSFPAAAEDALRARYAPSFRGGFALARHARPGELEESSWTLQGWTTPTLAFVDPAGTLQHYEKLKHYRSGLSAEMLRWLRLHQDLRRPGQAGALD